MNLHKYIGVFLLLSICHANGAAEEPEISPFLQKKIDEYAAKDKLASDQRAARLTARTSLTLAQRKSYDEKFIHVLSHKEHYKQSRRGPGCYWNDLRPLTTLSLKQLDDCDSSFILSSIFPSESPSYIFAGENKKYCGYQGLWIKIATDYLDAGANINVVDDNGNAVAINRIISYHQDDFLTHTTHIDLPFQHSFFVVERDIRQFYSPLFKSNHKKVEKLVWQRLCGSTTGNRAELVKQLSVFVPVVAVSQVIAEYLKPLPFADYLAQRNHIGQQHRLAFEQADIQAEAQEAKENKLQKKRKRSFCAQLFNNKTV